MTQFQGKKVDWSLYPDLVLPNERNPSFIMPREVTTARQREAFIQNQKRDYVAEDHSNTIARQTLDSILALLSPPEQDEKRSPDLTFRRNRRKPPHIENKTENNDTPSSLERPYNQEAKDRLSKLISDA